MNTRAKGRRNELRAAKALSDAEYDVCVTPNPSKWCLENDMFGLWDVIAVSGTEIRCVQVKTNNGASPAKRKLMEEWKCPPCVTREVWVYKDRVAVPSVRVWNGLDWERKV